MRDKPINLSPVVLPDSNSKVPSTIVEGPVSPQTPTTPQEVPAATVDETKPSVGSVNEGSADGPPPLDDDDDLFKEN